MNNFRTFDYAVSFYRLAKALRLHSAEKDQLRRAALSIVLNLAEGRGKATRKDQVRFFHIALGSVRECQAILEINDLRNTEYWRALDKAGAAVYKLIKNAR